MRSPKDARARWLATFATCSNLSDLRAAAHLQGEESPCERGLRSVCWKAFLIFENLDRSTWPRTIEETRQAYASLRKHFLSVLQNPDDVVSSDPLADDDESPWNTLRQDEVIRAEILQDVERCMPEYPFFREALTQSALVDILFIFCKLNADVGYRQGMHELLAPLYWIISQDAINDEPRDSESYDELMTSVLDHDYIEHDAFTLFCIVMQTAKSFYETAEPPKFTASASQDSPIIVRSQRIYNGYLRRVDRKLVEHLKAIDILPQIFVLRWIRLLFGREFPFEDVLALWDVVFAEDPTFQLVDLICVAMLLRIRWELLGADYTTALTLLLRYPLPPPPHSPMTLVDDAMYLQSHLSSEGGAHIITKYTSRTPEAPEKSDFERKARSLHTPQVSIDHTRSSPLRSPSRFIQDSGGIEAILQGAAKGVYQRGEKLGLNQALRGAVQQLQSVNSSPRRYISAARRSIDDGIAAASNSQILYERIQGLEIRNKALAKMLHGAMDDLNKQVRELEEDESDAVAHQLTLTIAKLQFVHVYLDDSTIPLENEPSLPNTNDAHAHAQGPSHELSQETAGNDEVKSLPTIEKDEHHSPASPRGTAAQVPRSPGVNPILETPTRRYTPARRPPAPATAGPKSPSQAASPTARANPPDSPFQQPRPSLAQTSYSWMLGGDHKDAGFSTASPFGPEQDRKGMTDKKARGKAGFLFGDDKDTPSASVGNARKQDRRESDDGFTMGTLHGISRQ